MNLETILQATVILVVAVVLWRALSGANETIPGVNEPGPKKKVKLGPLARKTLLQRIAYPRYTGELRSAAPAPKETLDFQLNPEDSHLLQRLRQNSNRASDSRMFAANRIEELLGLLRGSAQDQAKSGENAYNRAVELRDARIEIGMLRHQLARVEPGGEIAELLKVDGALSVLEIADASVASIALQAEILKRLLGWKKDSKVEEPDFFAQIDKQISRAKKLWDEPAKEEAGVTS